MSKKIPEPAGQRAVTVSSDDNLAFSTSRQVSFRASSSEILWLPRTNCVPPFSPAISSKHKIDTIVLASVKSSKGVSRWKFPLPMPFPTRAAFGRASIIVKLNSGLLNKTSSTSSKQRIINQICEKGIEQR